MVNKLSDGWDIVPIEKIATVISGGTPNANEPDNFAKAGKGIAWITPSDLSKYEDKYIKYGSRDLTEKGYTSSSARLMPKGSVLLSSRAPIGYVVIAQNDICTNQGFKSFIFNEKVNPEYAYFYLKSIRDFIERLGSGTTFKELSAANAKKIPFVLPPLDIQTQIAKILDKSTALIAKRKAQIAELDVLVQSVFLEMFGDPITNPKKLPKVELSELGIWKSGGTPSRANKAFFTGNIPWITSGELETLYIEDSKEHISEEAVQESAVKKIEIGSILLGMYDTAGLKSSITSEVVTCNQAIAFAKLDDDKVNTIFVYYCIQQQKSHLLKQQRGVRQKNFNLSMIKEINVLYPNLNLQTQFAQIVEKIQTQKSQLQQSLAELEMQHQALMQRAFRGELV